MLKIKAVEITAQDVYSVRAAIQGGANRVELCTALGTAGLTPSIGLVERAVEIAAEHGLTGFVDVLIRPREGDFIYDGDEIETAVRDIKRIVKAGVDGIVIGALRPDGTLDRDALLRMREAAEDTPVVFHRAFDVTADQLSTLDQLIEMGFVRVLTSGAAPVTGQGLHRLAELVQHAAGRIEIMAGGGLRLNDIPALRKIGVDAIHLSARKTVQGGPNRPGEAVTYDQADVNLVRAAVEAALLDL